LKKRIYIGGAIFAFIFSIDLIAATPRVIKQEYCVNLIQYQINEFTAFRENLLKLGYPPSVIDKKIEELRKEQSIVDRLSSEQNIKQLATLNYKNVVLNHLGLWEKIPGFSPHEFIWQFVSNLNAYETQYEQNYTVLKSLLYWSHYWVQGPHSFLIAKKIWSLFKKPFVAGWILKEYRGRQKQDLENFITTEIEELKQDPNETHQLLMEIQSYIPAKLIPNNFKSELVKWESSNRYPPIVNDFIDTVYFGNLTCGHCGYMLHSHLETLGLLEKEKEWRNNVLIYVKGMLVGSVKLIGNHSMIALRNVVRSNGQIVLMQGGTYTLPKDYMNEILALKKLEKGWQGINFSNLNVVPLSIPLNENVWGNIFITETVLKMVNENSKSQIAEEKIWAEILKRIDNVRRAFEH
jgi:hypothetical protein